MELVFRNQTLGSSAQGVIRACLQYKRPLSCAEEHLATPRLISSYGVAKSPTMQSVETHWYSCGAWAFGRPIRENKIVNTENRPFVDLENNQLYL